MGNNKVFKKYSDVINEIKELNVSRATKIKTFIFSFILGLLIISGPLTIVINLLFIFDNFRTLGITLIAAIAILGEFCVEYFYLKGITENKVKGLRNVIYMNTFIIALITAFIRCVVLVLGGI